MRKNKRVIKRKFSMTFTAILVIVFIVVAINPIIAYTTKTNVTGVTVVDKERVVERGPDNQIESKYLIFTDNETFENSDTLIFWKFNSSDMYGRIRVDQVCDFVVYGFRIPFLSMYRNIVGAECEFPGSEEN